MNTQKAPLVNTYYRTVKVLFLISTLILSTSTLAFDEEAETTEVDILKKQLKQIEDRLKTLEKTQNSPEQITSVDNEADQYSGKETTEQKIKHEQRTSHQYQAPDKSIHLTNSDTTLQIGGQIWLDAIYDDGEMTNRAGFQPSSISYDEGEVLDKTMLTVGQSNLFIRSHTPTKYGEMITLFEFDMFQSDGNAGFHLTKLWGQLGDFGAGQTFSGFMDIGSFPNIIDYWGPNALVFARQPQIRYTHSASENSQWMFTVERSDSDFATVNNVGVTPEYHAINDLPDFTSSYRYTGDFGYVKTAFLLRKLGYKTSFNQDSTMGWGLNVSGVINVNDGDAIKFQGFYGEGLGRYVNGTCCSYYDGESHGRNGGDSGGIDAGVDEKGDFVAIPVIGAFAYYDKKWSEKWTSSFGYSYLTVDNLSTQTNEAIKNSSYTSANIIWYPTANAKIGMEIQRGDIESKSGLNADNYRFQSSFSFKY